MSHGEDDGQEKQRKPSLAKLLKMGGDPNAMSFEDPGERRTLLNLTIEEACQTEEYSKIDLLLDSKADPNKRSESGAFPLQLAAKHGNMTIARKIIQRKADVNQQDQKLVTALHTAVHKDDARVVQLLLLHKANVNTVDKVGQPPIFFAQGRECLLALVEASADLLHLNSKGQSALHLAAHNGAHDTVVYMTEDEQMRHLLDLQDERGRSALHHAAARAHQSIVSRLMDVGADPRLRTNNGQTPMSLADVKDVNVAYYIYTRVTGGNKSTWAEVAQNPIALTLAAVIGVACFVNRQLLWEFGSDLVAIYLQK